MERDSVAAMDRVRLRFLERAAASCERLVFLVDTLGGPDGAAAAVDEVEHLAHRLAGGAGSFGLPGVSEHASLIERAVERLRRGEPADLPTIQATAHAVREDVEREVCRLRQDENH